MKKKVVKPKSVKKKEIVYFTDEMHKEIFLFQDKIGKGSNKPSISTVKL